MRIELSIFAAHHGHSICDDGFAHGKQAVRKRTRLGLEPVRKGNDLVHVFNGINKHTAELMEDRADKSFDQVMTMSGIQKRYHFTFADGDKIFMYNLAKDQQPSLVYQVTPNTSADGVYRVRNVTRQYT